jgi:hypothetical protein
MAGLSLNMSHELMKKVKATAERLWPRQGARAMARFEQGAISRSKQWQL